MRKGIIVLVGGLALFAGCKDQGNKASNIPIEPKWKGAPYHIAIDTKAVKPNASGVAIPDIKYTANPDALEKRVVLVVRLDTSEAKQSQRPMDQMIMHPVDISGTEGTLPADYMDDADKGLATLLKGYCMNGKAKITVRLVLSSISPQAGDSELDREHLSDWLPIEVAFKNPHPKC